MSYEFKGKISPAGAGKMTLYLDDGKHVITSSSYDNLGGGYTYTSIEIKAEANSGYTFSKFTYYLDGGQGSTTYNNPANISVGGVSTVSVVAYFEEDDSGDDGGTTFPYSATVDYKIDGSWGNKEVTFWSSSSSFTVYKSEYENQISTDLSNYYYLGCSTGSSWTQSQ